jgi:hypothetical protein
LRFRWRSGVEVEWLNVGIRNFRQSLKPITNDQTVLIAYFDLIHLERLVSDSNTDASQLVGWDGVTELFAIFDENKPSLGA